ncbi:DUF4144 family protein [Neptunomonas japonica]|uniref:Uncharacterized protein n=1 Tax=Neptunomonas japonica JAMM 1380 TaxID=1441457 RepID=A0A7R6SW03_9GAMM|nr:DUF4144 family protein [Neptunomonas japonica]BBB29980.1 conserved hypothetical protein [Neptunomonas japonica JAMM 1380]
MVLWPAIIKYEGGSELTYISSASEWECDVDLHFFSYEEGDLLIDSVGEIYALDERVENSIKPMVTGRRFDKDEIFEMIKERFSFIGACWVSKFAASQLITKAFKL